jgi:tetratricopeptide (TPR) repeat protein
MDLLTHALGLCQATQCARIKAQVLHRMGEACLLAKDIPRAVSAFEQALTITSDIGDLIGDAYNLQGIGVARIRQGKFDQARSVLHRAVELARSVGERMAEARALLGLAELALASQEPREAVSLGQRAAAVFEGMEAPLYEARALTLLSDAYAAAGDAAASKMASADAAILRTKLAGDEPIS